MAVSGSSENASCTSMDESLGLSEFLGAKEQESEGVAEKIQTTFFAALTEPRIQTRR